jgi:hypothetical protein
MAGGDEYSPGGWGPPRTQISRRFGVVEDQQPAVALTQFVPQELDSFGLLGGLGDVQPASQGDELSGDCGRFLGGDPPDQVIVAGVFVGVFEGELGLADTGQSMNCLCLALTWPQLVRGAGWRGAGRAVCRVQ